MFRAASFVGPATRPLLIFYGLSQAGRAIVADPARRRCATRLRRNDAPTTTCRRES
jgi:hypothetical protein